MPLLSVLVASRDRIAIALLLLLATTGCTNTLNRAIYREHPEAVENFLARGANVNEVSGKGGTPLIYAAQFGDLSLITTLVERGANVNWRDNEGNCALGYLSSGKVYKNEAVAFLLSHGAEVNSENNAGCTPLHLAVSKRCASSAAVLQAALVAKLLAAGADPNRATQSGKLPLHLAAGSGQPENILDMLLHVTKQPQAVTSSGYTALSEAARAGEHPATLYFVAHGFEPQTLVPAPPLAQNILPDRLDPTPSINARALEARGDFLLTRAERATALTCYQVSENNYRAAIKDCEQAVGLYTEALKEAKAGRRSRLFTMIALNAVGGGLAAATGVGFVAVPKRGTTNHIDEYAAALTRYQTALVPLRDDEEKLAAKLEGIDVSQTAGGKGGSPGIPAVAATISATAVGAAR